MRVAIEGRSVVAAGSALAIRATAAAAVILLLAGCEPSGPDALVRGDRALQAGRNDEAIRLLELAATKLPADAQAWNHLGLAYHAAGRLVDAQKAYLRALNFNRNLADVQYNLGELHLDLGNARDAEGAFRAYLNANPAHSRNTGAWRGLGQALFAQRQFAAAETSFGNILRLEPNDADAWNRIGLVRVQLRRHREAYQAFGQAVRLDPALASAHLNLAVTAQQYLGDRRAALQHYRDYLATNPADAEAVRRNVHDLEVRLGLVKPEAPQAVPTPPRPTNDVAPTRVATANPPSATNPVSVRPNPPVPEPARTSPPPAVVRNPRPTNPPGPAVVTTPPKPAPSAPTTPSTPTPAPTTTANPAPVTAVASSTTPARPEPAPEKPALQVVPVHEDPPPLAARDVAPTARPAEASPVPAVRPPDTVLVPPPAVVPAAAPVANPGPAPAPAASASEVGAEAADAAVPPERRTFWKKVNPVNWGNPVRWFKKDGTRPAPAPAPAPANAPAPVREVAAAKPAPAAISRPIRGVTPLELPPVTRPTFERYRPAHPTVAASGNRAAAEAEFQRGVAAHQRKDLAGAVASYRKAVQADPGHFEAHHNLAIAALELGDLPAALVAGEAAVALDGNSASARYNFAVALQRARHPEDAADQLAALVKAHPDDANAHLALGALCSGDLEDADRARREYERVLALSPSHPQAANIRRWLERNPARPGQ